MVIGASVLAGLGQSSLSLIFLWIALAIIQWIGVSGLIWIAGLFTVEGDVDYARLWRCTGFAYAWSGLQVASGLPLIGGPVAWAGTALFLFSIVLATREVYGSTTLKAALICIVAFALPAILFSQLFG